MQETSTPQVDELQIVHVRGNHWITTSTMFSKPNAVNVYDSLYDSIDEQSLKIIQQLFGIKEVHVIRTMYYRNNKFLVTVDYLQLYM